MIAQSDLRRGGSVRGNSRRCRAARRSLRAPRTTPPSQLPHCSDPASSIEDGCRLSGGCLDDGGSSLDVYTSRHDQHIALVYASDRRNATRAQDKFPSRTIRIIVPFAPGGGVDTLARLLAERMQAKMSVNVIVENRAGANGTIGGSHVMQSQPDGYTLLFSSNTHTMSKLVMNNAPYDPLADFTPIARGGEAPLLVGSRRSFRRTRLQRWPPPRRRSRTSGLLALRRSARQATLRP